MLMALVKLGEHPTFLSSELGTKEDSAVESSVRHRQNRWQLLDGMRPSDQCQEGGKAEVTIGRAVLLVQRGTG